VELKHAKKGKHGQLLYEFFLLHIARAKSFFEVCYLCYLHLISLLTVSVKQCSDRLGHGIDKDLLIHSVPGYLGISSTR
jgi:hypothetical protein